jgi:hypothetical protein
VAAVELPVARGKLKNRIKTFLGNPLCRGVDELCTELLNACDGFVAQMLENLERLREFFFREPGALELRRKEFGLKMENTRLKKETSRQDKLLCYYTQEKRALMYLREQREAVLMYYNELQSCSRDRPKWKPWR